VNPLFLDLGNLLQKKKKKKKKKKEKTTTLGGMQIWAYKNGVICQQSRRADSDDRQIWDKG